MDTDLPDDEEYMEQKVINEEYKVWKKNSVFLYDMMFRSAMLRPCSYDELTWHQPSIGVAYIDNSVVS
jgi:hypothetical protein